ncbi:kinase-like protein [Ceratobasidium sp. AG-I]|nr:kinase-like protein [Ceratobasidium sp. AG-I]
MSSLEVIACLADHGCENLTDVLDTHSCSEFPVSGGGFGDVYRGKLSDGCAIAIKTMRLEINSHEQRKHLKDAAREMHTWSKCGHPNVLKLLGLVEFRNQIGMVSLWMDNGALPFYLRKNPDADRCEMADQICQGLSYLHSRTIIHGDLKGMNIFVSDQGTPVLADFGNAVLQECSLKFTTTATKSSISSRWAAPEMFEDSCKYTIPADVYALGMTILETLTGEVPFSEKQNERAVMLAVAVRNEHPKRPGNYIPENSRDGNTLWSLLTTCWAYEPDARPSADEVGTSMKLITREGLTVRQDLAPVDSGTAGCDNLAEHDELGSNEMREVEAQNDAKEQDVRNEQDH